LLKINNILVINAGGGIGDAVQFLRIFDYLNKNLNLKKIYYYACDIDKFWFETKLKNLKPNNVYTIKSFPLHFGFRKKHIFFKPNLKREFGIKKFDLIIDNQTKIRNTLIYKRIPHQYYVSPTFNYFFSKPKIQTNKEKHVQLRIANYLEKILNKKFIFDNEYKNINKKFSRIINKLIKKEKKYIGFSIKAGHPTRIKEFDLNEITKVAKYFEKKNYIPTFFLEEHYTKEIKFIKKNIRNSFFPELKINKKNRDPSLVVELGKQMEFIITIDNGVMHMLALSGVKMFCFFAGRSDKFKPLGSNNFIYDCNKNNESIDKLSSEKIIKIIESNL
jgi:ADP-heptose:LPS heptosyltransferase